MPENNSEEYLYNLASKTFLSFWSYPNPANDKGRVNGKGDGKEICDLLVVFNNNIIIFSDKSTDGYPNGESKEICWKRWYSRSVEGSVKQLIGAKSWISRFPNKIWTEKQIINRFPLEIPKIEDSRFFLIAVAHSSSDECKALTGRESLTIESGHKINPNFFTVGTEWSNQFIHVFDDKTLDILMKELDTVSDFIFYLEEKENFLKSSNISIKGEENLLANYLLTHIPPPFLVKPYPSNRFGLIGFKSSQNFAELSDGLWNEWCDSDRRRNIKKANENSYIIDRLLEHHANCYFNRLMPINGDTSLSYHEKGMRFLAKESRLSRRMLGDAIIDIYNEENTKTPWHVICEKNDVVCEYYVFMVYTDHQNMNDDEIEAYYSNYLLSVMIAAKDTCPDAQTIIGVALPNRDCRRSSIITHVLDVSGWNENDFHLSKEFRKNKDLIAKSSTYRINFIE